MVLRRSKIHIIISQIFPSILSNRLIHARGPFLRSWWLVQILTWMICHGAFTKIIDREDFHRFIQGPSYLVGMYLRTKNREEDFKSIFYKWILHTYVCGYVLTYVCMCVYQPEILRWDRWNIVQVRAHDKQGRKEVMDFVLEISPVWDWVRFYRNSALSANYTVLMVTLGQD